MQRIVSAALNTFSRERGESILYTRGILTDFMWQLSEYVRISLSSSNKSFRRKVSAIETRVYATILSENEKKKNNTKHVYI